MTALCALAFPGLAFADTTVDFEDLAAGTVVTSQYADLGGAGQGVVFGPLPGGAGDGFRPVIRTPPPGEAQSGAQVADIANCPGCEFYTPKSTGTFSVPRSRVSMYVGFLGPPATCSSDGSDPGCAYVTLRALDAGGNQVAASAPALVRQGMGVHVPLSVSTPSPVIVGFELGARPTTDYNKRIAIDDLSFDTPSAPPTPDFTLTPASTDVNLVQGGSATDAITIGRIGGSAGAIDIGIAGALPAGVHAQFAPNPAGGSATTLTLTVDASAPPTGGAPQTVTFTGTPAALSAGSAQRSFTLRINVLPTCAHVATRQQLIDAVAAGYKCIFVENGAQIDMAQVADNRSNAPDSVLRIPDGVTLMSGRSPTVQGGLLYMSRRLAKQRAMLKLGANTRVTGLRLRGFAQTATKDRQDNTDAILVEGVQDVSVDNNEIYGWPNASVEVNEAPNGATTVGRIRVTRNFIHNNVQCGSGYGVVISGAGFVLIDRNVFNFNRHDVAGDGKPATGYIAELNFVLTSGPTCDGFYNQHFDMHGTAPSGSAHQGGRAGQLIEIRRNTIRGDQSYGFLGHLNRPAFQLRGTPDDHAAFTQNVVAHEDEDSAVRVSGVDRGALKKARKLFVRNNRYGVDTAKELAVSDFDGDGRADVFQATGAVWAYSPSGRREWHFLNDSSLRLSRLGFGDFNGDGKTDVFSQSGRQWRVSYSGTSAWIALPAGSSIDKSYYRFGDFDGDRKADVFRANGSRFYYSSAGATAWKPLAASGLKIGKLRFGDFNGDGTTDVFSLANGQWSVSYGGATSWRRLNRKLSSDLGELAFADFNGDGRTDVARRDGGKWRVSLGGITVWRLLQSRSQPAFVGMLFGDFTGDKRADVLERGAIVFKPSTPPEFASFTRFRLSSAGAGRLAGWSLQDMR